jgi:hypothetical protein
MRHEGIDSTTAWPRSAAQEPTRRTDSKAARRRGGGSGGSLLDGARAGISATVAVTISA